MKKNQVLALLLFIAVKVSFAQTEFRYEHYTIANGLSSNFTKAIEQDQYGFLWIGTIDGLNCFNGYDFTTYYNHDVDSTTISDNSINDLLTDKNGTLWVATNKGLNKFLRSTNTFQRFFSGSDHNTNEALMINHIESDGKDNLWLGTNKGIRILNTADNSIHIPEIKNDSLRKFIENGIDGIYFDMKGIVWLGSSVRSGFRLVDKRTLEPILFNPVANKIPLDGYLVSGFFEDKNGILWVLSENALMSYSRATNLLKYFTRMDRPNDSLIYTATGIIQDDHGEIWVSLAANPPYYTSIAKVNPQEGTFKIYPYVDNDDRGLAWSWASFVFQDKSGIYWIGTSRGLDKMDPLCQQFKLNQQFTNLKYSQFNNIYSIAKSGNILWFGSDGKGLIKYDISTKKYEQVFTEGSLSSVGLYYILLIDDSNLLLGSGKGVMQYNFVSGKINRLLYPPPPKGSGNSEVSCIINGVDGDVWVAWNGGGITRYNLKTKAQKNYRNVETDSNSLCSDQANVLFFDKKGTLWVGAADGVNTFGGLPGKGLDRFNAADETFTHFTHNEIDSTSLSNNNVVCIAEDKNDILWVGTRNGGLNRFDPSTGKFKRYTKNEGMPSNFITAIQVDDSNNIWVSSFTNGIACLNQSSGAIRLFDVTYGLQNIRFNRQSTYKSADGELYFGGVSGFNSFYPTKLKFNNNAPQVFVLGIKVNNATYISDSAVQDIKQMKLSYDQSELQFDFVAMNFSQSYKNKYAYQLVGYDKHWINVGAERTAKYTNLDPGTYVFKVKACNNDGVWNETGTSVSITIFPPWWKTWWAYLFYAIIFASCVFGIIVYRSARLKKENKLLEDKVTLRTSQLETSIHNLKATQSQLVQAEKLASLGALTAGIAHEIKNPLNFVNNFAELSNELLEELKEAKTEEEKNEIMQLLQDNLSKINQHGNRADSIVKNMLQHSRNGKSEKQLTDINQLCEEYLNLAYHGMRASIANFNCKMISNLDKDLPKVNCVAQDISRVVLNLINNAFDELKNKTDGVLELTTERINNKVAIKVKDNGRGIPESLKEKIFEPFFTTKPAGQGTGLGLSLSYDIIKAHGGTIELNSKDHEGTEFVIKLPL